MGNEHSSDCKDVSNKLPSKAQPKVSLNSSKPQPQPQSKPKKRIYATPLTFNSNMIRGFVLSHDITRLHSIMRNQSSRYTLQTLHKTAILTKHKQYFTSHHQIALYRVLSEYNLQDITYILSSYLSTSTRKTEREILSNMHHPFITSTHHAFQTDTKVHLVMDYFNAQQTLRSELLNHERLKEARAMFYGAEIYLAIEYCHKRNIILRDLMPEHILICEDGHLKITDVNVAEESMFINDRCIIHHFNQRYSPYVAPEVYMESGYNHMADWWSFGVILYEMMSGAPPFYDANSTLYFQAPFYRFMPRSAVHLISKLLIKNPAKRIQAPYIKTHAWFQSLDWRKVYDKEMKRPFTRMERMINEIESEYEEYSHSMVKRDAPPILLGGSYF